MLSASTTVDNRDEDDEDADNISIDDDECSVFDVNLI